jgi:hypothetical protein
METNLTDDFMKDKRICVYFVLEKATRACLEATPRMKRVFDYVSFILLFEFNYYFTRPCYSIGDML